MILKTVQKKKFDIEDSTESNTNLVTNYYSNIEFINKNLPLEHKDDKNETIELHFKNGNSSILILSTLKNNVWIPNYEHVFLMNDEGKTIERII